MNWKRAISDGLTDLYSIRYRNAPARGLRILLYHAVGTHLQFDVPGLSIEPRLFREQLRMLKTDGHFRPVPLDSALEADGASHRVCVTFDDGYRDNLTIAAPILAELGIPFTVFVVPAYILSGEVLYLNPVQLKELAEVPGCSIGSHGMNHRRLAVLDAEQKKLELEGSRRWIEDLLGKPVAAVSYPHGSADRSVRDAAAAAGYRLGVCSRTGVNDSARDPLLLCRTEILGFDGVRRFKQKLYGGWDWHRFRHKDPAAR